MIYDYSGYLRFGPLPDQKLQAAKELAIRSGLDIFLGPNALELEYSGRDTNRKIARLLSFLAEVIHDAEGEIVCTIEKEGTAPHFEFYSIRGGKLYRQKGCIVKEDTKEIICPKSDSLIN